MQDSLAHPSGMSQGLVVYQKLKVTDETFAVRKYYIPDRLDDRSESYLFKIEASHNDHFELLT